ncbi:MAG: hypothetical protein HY650_07355, partial [Acidobacteria bacterium]|nr:hypothetical protein [Acidobacteriota bacterium]
VVGERVSVSAAPSFFPNDMYLHAVQITKTETGSALTLRNESGLPLWIPAVRRGGDQRYPRIGGWCLDPSRVWTVTGIIESLNIGRGIQHPTVVLKVGTRLMIFTLGPERFLLESGLVLSPGGILTVRYAIDPYSGDYLALQLTDSEGNTIVLRNDDGTPVWNT